jgi:hypothetical protein
MRTRWGIYCSLLLVIVLSVSCERRQKDIIPRKKFVRLLTDLHLADGLAANYTAITDKYRLDSATLYQSVFDKYGITRAQFDTTLHYYSKTPDDFQVMYDQVIANLKTRENEYATATAIPQKDTVHQVWQDIREVTLPNMGKTNRLEVNIPVSGIGEYTVSADALVYRDDESDALRMTLYFYYDNGTSYGYRKSFNEIPFLKDDTRRTYTVSRLMDDPKVTHIKGFILNHSNADTLFSKHLVLSKITVTKKL